MSQGQTRLETLRLEFVAKFGREPSPGDPILFHPDTDTPKPLSAERLRADILQAMRAAGTPPQFIYAYEKTVLFVTREAAKHYSLSERKQYQAAIDEYFALEDAQALKRHD